MELGSWVLGHNYWEAGRIHITEQLACPLTASLHSYTVGVDIDPEALCVAQANVDQLGVEIDFLNADVLANLTQQAKSETATSTLLKVPFDTVIMNPPFGTKNQKHADYLFLKQAVKLSNHAVYSLHKSSTRAFLQRKAAELNLKLEVVAELRFDISNLYKFHKKNSVDVEVDLIRFSKQPAENQS